MPFSALAQAPLYEAARDYMRRSNSLTSNWTLLATVAAICLFWGCLYLWDRRRRTSTVQRTDPRSLFHELCDAHQLTREDRARLWKAAQRHALEQPALLFVNPAFLLSTAPDETSVEVTEDRELAHRIYGDQVAAHQVWTPGAAIAASGNVR